MKELSLLGDNGSSVKRRLLSMRGKKDNMKKMKMKKITGFSMLMLIAALAAGCAATETTESSTVESTESEVVTADIQEDADTQEDSDTQEDADIQPYNEILSKYKLAQVEQWDMERLMNEGVSTLCQYCYGEIPDVSGMGYLMRDMDGNGVDELLIGPLKGDEFTENMIFDHYTLEDGEAVQVFQGQERDRYYFTNTDVIYNEGDGGAGNFAVSNYVLDGKNLVLKESLINQSMDNPENPWRYTTDTDGDASNDALVTEEEAQSLMHTYKGNIVTLPYKPFTDIK